MQLTKAQTESLARLEAMLGYTFTKPHIGLHAITFPSIPKDDLNEDYEYLEFHGDRVYNLCTTVHIAPAGKPKRVLDMNLAAQHRQTNAYLRTMALDLGLNNLVLRNGQPVNHTDAMSKRIGDVVEAICGAVFLDSGFDFNTVYRAYIRLYMKASMRHHHPAPQKNAAP